MMIPNNYSINIAKKDAAPAWDGKPSYRHFATVELGQQLEQGALNTFAEFKGRFAGDDWKLTLQRVTCYGTDITPA